MAETADRKTYDIITVDWNPEQTHIWKYYIDKNCPTANAITIPEDPPLKWSKFSSKINCLLYDFPHPARVMYMDTDCIVTEDLEPLFKYMEAEDFDLGLSSGFLPKMCPFTGGHSKPKEAMDAVNKYMGISKCPPHYSSGAVLFRPKLDLIEFREEWLTCFQDPRLLQLWGGIGIMEEIAMAYALRLFDLKIWDLPREVHGNICGKPFDFGKAEEPMIIHYHKARRFARTVLHKYLSRFRGLKMEALHGVEPTDLNEPNRDA